MPADSAAEPFFEPLPQPEPVEEGPRYYPQLPWQPPINIVPIIVPLSVELARSDDTVVRLHGVDVYARGVTYDVRRPPVRPLALALPAPSQRPVGRRPRVAGPRHTGDARRGRRHCGP